MKKILYYLILACPLFFQSVFAQSLMVANFENSNADIIPETLVFQSGFEGNTKIVSYGTSTDKDIIGSDPDLPTSSWDNLQSNEIKSIYINYSGGDSTKRYARIVADPVNANNNVLNFCLKNYWLTTDAQEKGRIQLELYSIQPGYKEFYQSVRTYFSTDFNALKIYQDSIGWLTLGEFWNNEWWGNKPNGFRISVNIHKDSGYGKNLYFAITAEDSGFIDIWNVVNKNIAISIGNWSTIEYYFREGNKDTGRFYMAITPDGGTKQIICDVTGFTHGTKDTAPDGLTGYNPMKLYTSKQILSYLNSLGRPLNIYWDDLKLWKNKRP